MFGGTWREREGQEQSAETCVYTFDGLLTSVLPGGDSCFGTDAKPWGEEHSRNNKVLIVIIGTTVPGAGAQPQSQPLGRLRRKMARAARATQ